MISSSLWDENKETTTSRLFSRLNREIMNGMAKEMGVNFIFSKAKFTGNVGTSEIDLRGFAMLS